jgi:putative ABC transport system permease protein
MLENIALAFQGIWAHKLRSFLTMLGIIIGIASIITIVSTIKGTNEQIKENLIGSGTNAVTVLLNQDDWEYEYAWAGLPDGVTPLTEDTRQTLLGIEDVEEDSFFSRRRNDSQVFRGNTAFNGYLYGVDGHYFDACGYRLSYGRLFLPEDAASFRKVIILDGQAATALFAGEYPIGQILEVRNETFTVVGVVEKAQSAELEIETIRDYYTYADTSGGAVFIPLADWPIVFQFDEPQNVVLRAAGTDAMTSVGQQAEDILKAQIHRPDDTVAYKSENLMEQAEQLQALANSTNRQLLWIAGISLLVGGIGVMNIMLVTVTERTREIGLKKAIGARKRRILWQFLTEAAALTSIGGILGVAAGIVFSRVISSVSGTPSAISLPASAVAVAFSMLIGILFGMIPAVKAANLNPIEALRRE